MSNFLTKKFHKKNSGFTMIEMMISVLIISMIVMGGIAAYTRYSARQQVVNAGSNFVVKLRDVQKRAQSGDKPPTGFCSSRILEYWRVVFDAGASSYTFGPVCTGAFNASHIVTEQLPAGTRFGGSGTQSINFAVLTGNVTGNLNVSLTNGTATYTISISSAGGINDQGIY